MKKNVLGILAALVLVWACGGSESNLTELNLLPFGMPISIQAPADTMVTNNGELFGIYDVIVESSDTNSLYSIQIYLDQTNNNGDINSIVQAEKTKLESDTLYSEVKYLLEEEKGYICQFQTEDGQTGYDFFYVMLRGITNKYTFTTSKACYSEKGARMMYNAIKED